MHPITFHLLVVWYIVTSTIAVVLSRLRGRPAHPNWPLLFEIGVSVERKFMLHGFDQAHRGFLVSEASAPRDPRVALGVSLKRSRLAGLDVEVHTPRAWRPSDPTILYLHGGGYVACSPGTHRDLVTRLARAAGARCIVPNYRKAPQHPFPDALHAAAACFRELVESGVAPSSLFVAGDSAGGGLALAVTLFLRDTAALIPRGLLLLSPWVDLAADVDGADNAALDILNPAMVKRAAELYAGSADLTHPHVSPVHASLEGLPPMLVQTGENELFYQQNLAFAERAREAGIEIEHEIAPAMVHVFQTLAVFDPTAGGAIARLGGFVRQRHRVA